MGEYTRSDYRGSTIDTAAHYAKKQKHTQTFNCESKILNSTCISHQTSATSEGSDAAEYLENRINSNPKERDALIKCSGCFLKTIINVK